MRRYYPLMEIRRPEDVFERVWRGLGRRNLARPYIADRVAPLDIEERDDSVIVRVSLPGATPEDIRVEINDGVLNIDTQAAKESDSDAGSYLVRERRNGPLHRTIRLPDSVEAEEAAAAYEHGVLTVSFPKIEAKKPKRIEVKVVG